MTARERLDERPAAQRAGAGQLQVKPVTLALQGGGAHGAFAWGVLDRLLEDGRIDFEGISATSAGAMNAVVLAYGLMQGGPAGARQALHGFWRDIAASAALYSPFRQLPGVGNLYGHRLDHSPFYLMTDMLMRVFSPYQFNPFNFNPLRQVLGRHVDFAALRENGSTRLYLCATNVESGKVRIFPREEICIEAVLASACLPFLFQAVEIDGVPYWDGGYVGNPAIYPLIYECASRDVVIVHINPIVRRGVPKTAAEILNRINEVSFNSSLMRELRAIAFVTSLIERGQVADGEMKRMLIHSIRADETMAGLGVSSKLNADWRFLCTLRDRGRAQAGHWLAETYDALGERSSVDIRAEFL
ncbi:patatin-like phospholipase family protein [Azotobacter chroococcum]|uniref:NTE family protein n=1 Tax=Azotobacter chroococcum TaxID=353 RepID=A0A4V6NG55_9GAMM|nr:patatin-like phospholipase family protein [Azotobacter chroococcum]TBV99286.1 patatin-like phospholipase family protein [Azotobacter chroococcum]TCL29664.1 NTE family protein [Azotobacter chroococcum]